jgi:uncharacterized membrane-anchored protein YitT (DUF2179 family)
MDEVLRKGKNIALIVAGIFSAGFGLKGFLLSSRFIDGGVTGISMLIAEVSGLPLAALIFAINIPFVIIGYKQIGRTFAIKSALAISGLALCLFFVHFPDVTPDKLLTAVFGGFFIGAGIGLSIRGGDVLDGTEITALLISRQSMVLRVGDVILVLNIFIFLAAALLLSVESALYSILTYVAASKTIDFLIHGVEEYTAVTIVSQRNDQIRLAIIDDLGRGVTIMHGAGGMGSTGQFEGDIPILYCVVTRLEIGRLLETILAIDSAAFITTHSLSNVRGGLIKKNVLH